MSKSSNEIEKSDVEIEANKPLFDDAQLYTINSAADLGALFDQAGGSIDSFDDYGNGFQLLSASDRARLIGVDCVAIQWRFSHSKQYNTEFVSIMLVTESGERWILNDGSTGIYAQIRAVTNRRIAEGRKNPQAGLRLQRGLRRSDYLVADKDGNEISATTYYLA